MILVLGAIFGVVLYRIIMVAVFYSIEPNEVVASLATSLTASVINLIAIMILSVVCNGLLAWLTQKGTPFLVEIRHQLITPPCDLWFADSFNINIFSPIQKNRHLFCYFYGTDNG